MSRCFNDPLVFDPLLYWTIVTLIQWSIYCPCMEQLMHCCINACSTLLRMHRFADSLHRSLNTRINCPLPRTHWLLASVSYVICSLCHCVTHNIDSWALNHWFLDSWICFNDAIADGFGFIWFFDTLTHWPDDSLSLLWSCHWFIGSWSIDSISQTHWV